MHRDHLFDMVDPIDDIARQARQGSVSAIIQVLNEELADSGVRTRAIFDGKALQLLCEAATPEQLEQTTLVPEIRRILESLQPRNIRRININSRIVREQQLLWLDEINRDRKNQLLWAEEITLSRGNPLQRLFEDWFADKSEVTKNLPKPVRAEREKRQFWRGIIGGISLSLLLILLGWVLTDWLGLKSRFLPQSVPASPSPTPSAPPVPPQQDPFVQAVRIAEQSVQDGQRAQSAADWLDIAARWQRASDLMSQVPPADNRYRTAQDRIKVYSENSKAALARAEQQRQLEDPSPSPTGAPSP